jgi:PII-like signaling protein
MIQSSGLIVNTDYQACSNVMVYTTRDGLLRQDHKDHSGRSLYIELIRRLRLAGASGATAVRRFWGYHGDHAPHCDVLLSLRRRVPVITTVVDTAERSEQWFRIVDELTDETGLVTSEMVPASRAFGPGYVRGGTELARRLR